MRKMHSDYDLSKISERKKYIDAINKRILQTVKTFGKDSLMYKNMITNLKQLMYDRTIFRENKEGVVQLSKSKKYLEKDSTFTNLSKQKYLDKPTTAEHLNTTLEKMKERGEIDKDLKMGTVLQGPPNVSGIYPTVKNQVIDYTNAIMELNAEIREDYAFLYGYEDDPEVQQALNILEITGRRKTYNELQQVKEAIYKVKKQQGYFDNDEYSWF